MPGRARRQLLIDVLSRVRRLAGGFPPEQAKALNLLLTLPSHPRIMMSRTDRRFGADVVGTGGKGLAALRFREGETGRIEAWGDPVAENEAPRSKPRRPDPPGAVRGVWLQSHSPTTPVSPHTTFHGEMSP
ncbi:MAG TPA: hypothetical protein VHT30_05000 [Acidimicrobiales bacterium]|nr:hypothetical protein [Acidimicrobiales bacterium]